MLSQLDGPGVKVLNKQPSVSNLQMLIDKIDNPDGKGLKASTIEKALREIQVLSSHPNATAAQKNKFDTLTSSLNKMMSLATSNQVAGEYDFIGWAPQPGWGQASQIPSDATPLIPGALYTKFVTEPNGMQHWMWYMATPMGVEFVDGSLTGHSYTDNSPAATKDAFAYLYNLLFHTSTYWLKANGLAGSGNVQNAENTTGLSKFSLADAANDGFGGYFRGLVNYTNFLNLVTNPNFQVHNQTALQKIEKSVSTAVKTVAKDVSTAAKAVVKEASTIAKGVEHVVALVAASPARLAAIELIKSNDMNLATMLAQAWQKDKTKVSNFWYTFGGSPSELLKAINQGAHTSLSGQTDYDDTSIGDVSVTPKNATASAIVNAIISFLRSMGIPIPPVVQDTVNKWLDKAATVLKQGATTVAIIAHNIDGSPPNAGVFKQEMTAPSKAGMPPILLIGAAATLGLIFLSDNN